MWHAFAESAHPTSAGSTSVQAWRDGGTQPIGSSHSVWDHHDNTSPPLRFLLPFDAHGRSTIPLRAHLRSWHRGDDVDDQDRVVRGRVVRGSGVVYRELWVNDPPVFRPGEGIDFDLEDDTGLLARCFLMGIPLVATSPARMTVHAFAATLGDHARSLASPLTKGRGAQTGTYLELREGAALDLIGRIRKNPRAATQSASASVYRAQPVEPPYLVGRAPLSHLRIIHVRA